MKRNILALSLLLPAMIAMAGTPAMSIDAQTYDFGTIREADGTVSHEFTVTNTGDAPLIIASASASCGCTTPSVPKMPVKPGESATVKVSYNPLGRPGEFEKHIRLKTNLNKRTSLKIKGVVVPSER